jgi:hypothetical protein
MGTHTKVRKSINMSEELFEEFLNAKKLLIGAKEIPDLDNITFLKYMIEKVKVEFRS